MRDRRLRDMRFSISASGGWDLPVRTGLRRGLRKIDERFAFDSLQRRKVLQAGGDGGVTITETSCPRIAAPAIHAPCHAGYTATARGDNLRVSASKADKRRDK